ncbi:MAG: diaminopimelate epimerase [Chitinophagales bacterium]|nr:diaminopimelate epimerase [Chitinophagales bacterium]
MEFEILKCHGSGNDFILIDERKLQRLFTSSERCEMAKVLCDRTKGIGADGILYVQDSPPQDGRMVIYNADGSEASMCGNGLRCVVRMVADSLNKTELLLATKGGVYETRVVDGFFEEMKGYSVKIDTVDFDVRKMLPAFENERLEKESLSFLPQQLQFSAVNVPNPHIIAPLKEPNTRVLVQVGERCNLQRDHFIDGVNINFFTPISETELFVETYERGVGLTNACGTGMLASTLIASRLGYIPVKEWISIYNKGGFVRTRVLQSDEGSYSVELLGNATWVFTGAVSYNFDDNSFSFNKTKEYTKEVEMYQQIAEYAQKQMV